MKGPKPEITSMDRPTISRIIPAVVPQRRKIEALPETEVVGDCGIGDFQKWVKNFHQRDSGHFTSAASCNDVALELGEFIEDGSGIVKSPEEIDDFLNHIISATLSEAFVSLGAADDFCRQVKGYIEVDGYIGKQTMAPKSQSRGGRRRKAKG